MRINIRLAFSITITVALAGCTADAYKRSADMQVNDLLKDRKQQTLGYQPQTAAPITVSPRTSASAYSKLPVSPLPPVAMPPLEPSVANRTWQKLGPPQLFSNGTAPAQSDALRIDEARQPGRDRLTLGPPAVAFKGSSLDLFKSLAYATQHSRDYQTQMEDVYIAALDVTLQRHLFDPIPFATTGLEFEGGQRDVSIRSALAVTNTIGVRQRLPYGGSLVAEGLVDFVNGLNGPVANGESASLVLSGSIPLLRGAGVVNLEPLIESERLLVYNVRQFEDYRRVFAVNVASSYFTLLTRQQAIRNRRFNYVSLADLTERTLALYASGRLNFLQVQRSLQSQLAAEDSLNTAEDSYQSALDQFKILLGMPVEEGLDVLPIELTITTPDLDNTDYQELALRYRLDLQTARDQMDDARRRVANAKNGLLPDLDLDAKSAIGNRADTPARSIDSRTNSYQAGITLGLPLDRLAERNVYRRSLIDLERAQRGFEQTRDQILSDVRSAVRGTRTARASVEIQRRGIDLAQRRLEYSTELLVQGRATDSRDVVDAQSSLLTAQDAYEQARANLQTQVLQFLRSTGTLRVDPSAGSLGRALDRESAENPGQLISSR